MKTKYSSRAASISKFSAQRNDIIELATAHIPFDVKSSSSRRILMDAVEQVLPEYREGKKALTALSLQTVSERVRVASTETLYIVLKALLFNRDSFSKKYNIQPFEDILINELISRR